MQAETEKLALTLKPGEDDRLLGGHLWVFSNELKDVPKTEPGVLAEISTSKGRCLGLGFYNPHSLIAFRFLTRRPEAVDADFFHARLERALALRRSRLAGEDSFRLCFGESDALPGLVVDKYGDVLVAQALAAGMERRLPDILSALERLLHPKGIYLKNDHPSRALEGLPAETKTALGEVPKRVVIESGGLKYAVALGGGSQKTGFYFDQRDNREFLGPFFKGRTVLDVFCFSGAFALAAARHGAARVLGLDSSAGAVDLARENARLNGLEKPCEFDEGDAGEVLEAFAAGGQPVKPDFILLDPPSFAHSRKHLPSALRAYAKLNALALRCLKSGGLLATSTCSHHVGREDFLGMLRAAALKAQKPCRLLALRGQAQDHPILLSMPETEYLHFALLEAA
ncbi:MAG: class I SAM-dependent rRNA methyltransferase [Elusimicrobia bacterium]|nr:class I SAM-dependent rRNA methyltransferase [Elusimicrobiota bacterium]